MKTISRKRTVLAVALAAATLLAPLAAHAGIADVLSLLTSITGTLRNSVAPVLNGIESVEARVSALQQQVLWPLALIAQARNSIAQIRGQLAALAAQIHAIDLRSATLAGPSELEQLLRSRSAGSLDQISISYRNVFLSLPPDPQASVEQRQLMDIDDALALTAMKTASLADASGQSSLAIADALEQQASIAAPGSAGLLSAQAHVASLENQAMLQKMLAAELRQEAATLAHANALAKQGAQAVHDLGGNLVHVLRTH